MTDESCETALRLLEQRASALESRCKVLEDVSRSDSEKFTKILVEIVELRTRVGYLAAGIGSITGVVASVVTSVLKTGLLG